MGFFDFAGDAWDSVFGGGGDVASAAADNLGTIGSTAQESFDFGDLAEAGTTAAKDSTWDSVTGWLGKGNNFANALQGGLSLYSNYSAGQEKDAAAKQAAEDRKMNALLSLAKLKYGGGGGGGGSDVARTQALLGAIKDGTNTQVEALSRLSSGYSAASKR